MNGIAMLDPSFQPDRAITRSSGTAHKVAASINRRRSSTANLLRSKSLPIAWSEIVIWEHVSTITNAFRPRSNKLVAKTIHSC